MLTRCIAGYCSNTRENGFTLRKFARDPVRREKWIVRVQRRRSPWVPNDRMLEDGSEVRQGCQGNNVEEKGVKRGGPKKLFQWNDEIRELLGHLLREKLAVYESRREGNQHLDDYLKALLVNDVKTLWPKGWMQSRVLLREGRKMLGLQLPLPTKRNTGDPH